MTVKEMVSKLQLLPPDAPVMVYSEDNSQWIEVGAVEVQGPVDHEANKKEHTFTDDAGNKWCDYDEEWFAPVDSVVIYGKETS
jgi:hypothetical protein